MLTRKLRNQQRGDTIVEVLIATAIVSLILTISYATSTHNVGALQDSKEHAQALQLAQREIEFLKADNAVAIATDHKTCYDQNGIGQLADSLHPGSDPCTVMSDGTTVTSANFQPAYSLKISGPSSANDPYVINVNWASAINTGKNNLTLYYRP